MYTLVSGLKPAHLHEFWGQQPADQRIHVQRGAYTLSKVGKQIISVRVSDEVAQAIDQVRGSQPRSSWLLALIAPALGEPVYSKAKPENSRIRESVDCPPHPRGRVIKGFCYRCGMPAT